MSPDFDERLKQRLLAFQEHHGLSGAGVADTQTWDRLMNATPPGGGHDQGDAAATRALEIDRQVQANADMSPAELERLLQERNRLLPLIEHPPAVRAAAPPEGMSGAITLAAGMMIVPTTTPVGGGVPPSILFGPGTEAAAGAAEATVVTTAEAATAAAEVAAAETAAAELAVTGGILSAVPVAGWIAIGVIVVGAVGYLVYRHYSQPERVEAPSGTSGGPVVAPPATPAGPVSAPGAPHSGPVSLPGGSTSHGPVSLPGASTGVRQLQVSSEEVESARHRLDQLERSGGLFRDVGDLRDRLGAEDDSVRRAAQAELVGLEREVSDFERQRRGEDISTPRSVPLTQESAFEELMHRYPAPLNTPPYNQWPRDRYTPVRLQPGELSTEPGEVKRILVIRAPNGTELRFSVIWRDGVFQDIHESSGPSDRQQ